MKRSLFGIAAAAAALSTAGSMWGAAGAAGTGTANTSPGNASSVSEARRKGPPPALMLTDRRLEEPVICSLRTGTLETYASHLSERALVRLEIDDPQTAVRVSVLNASSNTRRLLHGIEWISGATWLARDGKEPYRLERTQHDLELAAAKRAKEERLGRARLQQRASQAAKWAYYGPAQLAELRKSEPGMASCLADSRSSAMAQLAFGLPGELWNSMWSTGAARLPISRLPEKLQSLAFEGAGADNAQRHGGLTEQMIREQGMLKLQIAGPPDHETIWLSIQTGGRGTDNNLLFAEGWTRPRPAARRAEALAHPTPVPDDPLFRRKISIKDNHSPGSAEIGERPEKCLPMLPLLEQVAAQVKVPILVQTDFRPRPDEKPDARHDHYWLLSQWWLAEPILEQPLGRALDLLCADFMYEWTYRDGAILLRHKRWYLPEDERESGKRLDPVFPRKPAPAAPPAATGTPAGAPITGPR